ncbi:hypothetical protein D3C74_198080 [compost metagenome]
MNAAQLLGIEKLPAVVKEKLTDEEALMYVVETNVLQRSFTDMLPSEKAKVLTLRHSEMFSQGKRTILLRSLKAWKTRSTSKKMQLLPHWGRSPPVGIRLLKNTVYLKIPSPDCYVLTS